jgi:lipoyl(octanoyl) transferase
VAASASPTSTADSSFGALPTESSERKLLVCRAGTVEYDEAWKLQAELAETRGQDRIPDVLLLLQHPHTYTLGRRGTEQNILLSSAELRRRGIAVYRVDRGGDVTYHGPGQLVGYPILKLPAERLDYVRYIRDLELALLSAVRDLGIEAHLQEGFSGIWMGDEKLCAIGVKIDARGVTSHGFAINVNVDLGYFAHIVPCGIKDKGVTSLARIEGKRVSMARVEEAAIRHLSRYFSIEASRNVRRGTLSRLLSIGRTNVEDRDRRLREV